LFSTHHVLNVELLRRVTGVTKHQWSCCSREKQQFRFLWSLLYKSFKTEHTIIIINI